MRKKRLKKSLLSVLLAGALAVTSFGMIPAAEVHAASSEGKAYSPRVYDSSYDSQYAYSGDDLGCNYTPERTTFKVWSPEASSVVLCRYEKGNGGSVIEEVSMTRGDKGVWSVTVDGNIVDTYYTYKVTVNGTTKEAVDIYAKAVGVNGDRAMVVDLDSTDPENWDTNYQREKTNLSDIIVWEIHIRDFSIDASSGVSTENRGKYKAFTESTTVNGDGKTASCVDYLKKLGVTHVQILPMYDYASVDETNVSTSLSSNYNWGYDPENYNAPEGSYSSNPYDGNVRITEMKEMIQALHDAGIKVIMDVVYNHTYSSANSNFNKIMPGYYYKLENDLSFNNQSGCGNATRSDSAMYRKFMIESITYWAEEYNLDGFRFDLMGIHDIDTMNQIRKTLDNKFGEDTIVMYGEGWTGNSGYDSNSAHKAHESSLDDGIGYFNDQIRDAIKGEHKYDGTIGLVQTNYVSGSYDKDKWPNNVFGGIMGSVGKTDGEWGMWRPFWSKSSNCVISYASAHDNLTLWDKLTEGFGKDYNSTNEKLLKMNKMAGSVILTSKGGVFMQAGEEFARTKNGDENSYASSDTTNRIDWNRVRTYSSVQQYYEGMIKIRKAFSGFRSITTRSGDNWHPDNNNLDWISTDEKGLVAFYESNNVSGEWSGLSVLINNALSDTEVDLSKYSNNWVVIADGTTAGLEKIRESGSKVSVPAKSVVVAVPKDTFETCDISENKAPDISVNSAYEVAAGESLSFTAEISDKDGDALTVNADGLSDMPGATFNASTGAFLWNNAVSGNYKLTISASDGKATTTKTITITVTEKTDSLKKLIAEIKKNGYAKIQYTDTVWTSFEHAFAEAQEVVDSGETDDQKITDAYSLLKSTYDALNQEAQALEDLNSTLIQGETKLANAKADADNYDAAAIEDLQTVIEDVREFLEKAHVAADYESRKDDVEDAMKACVSLKANPTVRVKADNWSSPAVYIWKGTGDTSTKLAGAWPGTRLSTKDAEGWYVYELPEGTTGYSLIVNDGASGTSTQTEDITNITGSVDITVTSFTGKTCTYTKEEHEVGSGTIEVDRTGLSSVIARAEQVMAENPDSSQLEALTDSYTSAKAVYADADATQVELNQTVRALKEAIKAVEEGKDTFPPNAPTDMTVEASVQKVSDVQLNTGWVWSDTDKDKTIESGSTLTVTAVYNGEDKDNYQITEVTVKITKNSTDCEHKNTVKKGEKAAACTEAGYEGDLYCNDCEKTIQKGKEIPATGHRWDSGTSLGNGKIQYECTVCGKTKTETVECSFKVQVNVEEYIYDGSEKKPKVVVTDGDTVLKEDADYTVTYQNNINACDKEDTTAGAKLPTVTVTGKGDYINAVISNGTVTFTILPRELSADGVSISEITDQYIYTGNAMEPQITITDDKAKITEKDYEVSYSNNTNAGNAKAIITGTGNYRGTIEKDFIIKKAAAPANTPEDMNVSVDNGTLSNVVLPTDWKWSDEDKDRAIENGTTIIATAVYDGADKDNYEDLSVTINVTGISCKHEDESKYEVRNKVDATCTKEGYTGDIYCGECQTKISNGKTIEAVGHQWNAAVTVDKNATCTEKGRSSIHCSRCDAIKEGTTADIPALGHIGGMATCCEQAICSRCNEKYGEYDSNKHVNGVVKDRTEPTCTKEGYTGDTYCSACNELQEKGEVIAATGHVWDEGTITKEPTQNEDGEKAYTCKTCGERKYEIIKAGDDSSQTTEIPATTETPATMEIPEPGTQLTDTVSGAVYEVMVSGKGGIVTYLKATDKTVKNVTIPATVTLNGITYKVTAIAENAFKSHKKIENVTIKKNVKTIEENAFNGCTNLKSVTIGSDVNTICTGAFSGCKKLTKVRFGNNLIVIGNKAFYKCKKLNSIVIPSKVSRIGNKAFYGCNNLKKITIKTKKLKNKTVGDNAFKNIYSKATIKVPKSKLKLYKQILTAKGVSKKAKIKK